MTFFRSDLYNRNVPTPTRPEGMPNVGPMSGGVNAGAPANLGGSLGGMGIDPSIIERLRALFASRSGIPMPDQGQSTFNNLLNATQGAMGGSTPTPDPSLLSSTFNNLLNTTQGAMGGSSQEDTGGSAPMSNPFMGGSPFGFSIDQSMIDRIREIIRQRQQQMAQPSSQPPQIDPAAIQARLDEFLANNPERSSFSLPFGGSIDIGNLRDRMARLSALMGRGMSFQEAMGNQRAAIAQGHDLNNDGIVTDAEYRQSTMPAPTGEFATNPASGTPMIEERISQLMNAVGGGRM